MPAPPKYGSVLEIPNPESLPAMGARVMGGYREFVPYMVALEMGGGEGYGCSGTIIDECWILTAAHCVVGITELRVTAGTDDRDYGTDLPVNATHVFPSYQRISVRDAHGRQIAGMVYNDIALINLVYAIEFREGGPIQWANLPRNLPTVQYPSSPLIASGFGYDRSPGPPGSTVSLRYSHSLEVVNEHETYCRAHSRTFDALGMLCTSRTPQVGMASADSGGPLVMYRPRYGPSARPYAGPTGKYYVPPTVIGIMSYISGTRFADYWTKVDWYRGWINSVIYGVNQFINHHPTPGPPPPPPAHPFLPTHFPPHDELRRSI